MADILCRIKIQNVKNKIRNIDTNINTIQYGIVLLLTSIPGPLNFSLKAGGYDVHWLTIFLLTLLSETLGQNEVVSINVLMQHVTSVQFLQFFNYQEKRKNNPRCTAPIYMYVLSTCTNKIASVEGLPRYRPYKTMNTASLYKKFHIISKFSHFYNIQEIIKINPSSPRCTASIYVLSMYKRIIKAVEGLLIYWPFKLMNIASLYKKCCII